MSTSTTTSTTTSTVENTALRLTAILEILAASETGKLARASVLQGAFERFPLNEHESTLLAGDIPRGEKNLILASGRLVKKGWIVKAGRSGWSITDAGRRALAGIPAEPTAAESTPQPDAVAVPGDFNRAMGCPENWMPAAEQTQLTLDPGDHLWKLTSKLPAGKYSYKAALNRSWAENYGADAVYDGPNITFEHAGGDVTFVYHHGSKLVRTA